MKAEEKYRLRQNSKSLEANLNVDAAVEGCMEKGILDDNDRMRIQGERSRGDRALKLLRIVMHKEDDGVFKKFLQVLQDSSQSALCQQLEATVMPPEILQQGKSEHAILVEALKECLVEQTDKECSVQDLVKALRLQLRRRQQYHVQFRSADIFAIVETAFPAAKRRKNKRKKVVAIVSCIINPEVFQFTESNYEDGEKRVAQAVPVEQVSCCEVVKMLRHHLEKGNEDMTLADRFVEEDIDGKALVLLTDQHLQQLFPHLKMGPRLRFMEHIKATIAGLQKPPESAAREEKTRTLQKLETFRQFDHRGKVTEVYEKGHILPEEQSRPGFLLQPVHKYCAADNGQVSTLAEEAIRFFAACMNERVNGTIHFGVVGKYTAEPSCQAGEVVGIQVDRQQCEAAITEEIHRAFCEDQRETALRCIRDPVFIPVVGEGMASALLYVVEIDVVPDSTVVLKEAFFLNVTGKDKRSPVLFRYIDGAPIEVTGKELEEFMDSKEKQSRLREDCEKGSQAQPAPKPDLHRKLHSLLTDGKDYEMTDIFPLLVLSHVGTMSPEYVQENFSCIRNLEPFCVFDFGPPSSDLPGESHLVYDLLENQLGQVYETLTTDNFDKSSPENMASEHKDPVGKLTESLAGSSFRPWIFCNGYGPMEKEELKPAAWRSQRGQGFKEAVRFYQERFPNVRIVIFLLSGNYEVLLGALDEIFVKFPEQWILIAESEMIARELQAEMVRRCYVEKEVLEERSVIGMPWSQVSQSILKICGCSSSSGCLLPSSADSQCHMKERDKNLLPDLEILSVTQCSDENFVKSENNEEIEKKNKSSEKDFYNGQQVSWWNFYFEDHVRRRSGFDKFLELVQEKLNGEIQEDESVAVVPLFHQRGAGGTTTARHILWELREEFRCCVIRQISDPQQTCDQITNLRNFEEPENPKPPLVLIDNEDEEKVIQLRSYMNQKARREARDCRGKQKTFCVLLICIRGTKRPKRKEDQRGEKEIILSHELDEDEAKWFRIKYETLEDRYKKKQLTQHPKLLISFNIMKENFNPDYIKNVAEEFVSDIKDFKERRFLKFVALINSFDRSFRPIPLSCFNAIMAPGRNAAKSKPQLGRKQQNVGSGLWQASLSDALNILLNRTRKQYMGGSISAVRIINSNLSKEILNNLCPQEKEKMSEVVKEFLDTDVFKTPREAVIESQLVPIVRDVLKKRTSFEKRREKFSPLILEIGHDEGYEQAAEVLEKGFYKFDDPMIGQQVARVYIHCNDWETAETFAKEAQDMNPKNSYLCDTLGQVYKAQLMAQWKECFEDEYLEGEKARELIDIAFEAIKIFRREQELSDFYCTSDYNNCGFFSELQVIVTLLDCCGFLKPFEEERKGGVRILHRFLVEEEYTPDGLSEEIGEDRIKLLKHLHHEYEKPLRRLEDEQIQLKEDPQDQYNPAIVNSSGMLVRLLECLDSYFGENDDKVPRGISEEEACKYRRRRVKRKGGHSLFSIYELRAKDDAEKTFQEIHSMLQQNICSEFCNAFDLKTVLNVTMAQISKDRRHAKKIPLKRVLAWTQELYEKSKHDGLPYLEAYLYFVMMNWPTEWRNSQHFEMFPCSKMKEAIKEWKEAFQNAHPAQKEEEGKKPDRRKSTTLFFLGEGEGFDEIVFYNELQDYGRLGDRMWDSKEVQERLKRLKGTLQHGGKKVLIFQRGSDTSLIIPTSYPITDHSMWQKSVYFMLGFCWSGPKAFSVTRDGVSVDLGSALTPLNPGPSSNKRHESREQRQLSEQETFFESLKQNQAELDRVEKDLRLCTLEKRRKDLEQKKKTLERKKGDLLQKRTSVLQGPD